ncbi:ABC transporter permease [Kribbia dieselivorans]|uniref:ABC transporter permease n=1 Tax=Kribbia dieselivorans TaxID=331526 RepID=UPI0008393DA7|nr:ABC transporter permease [Kribbia dieselivorans]
MRAVLAIAAAELRRFVADKGNIFFVFIFPLALVFVIGSQFGGSASIGSVALVGANSPLKAELVTQLEAAEVKVTSTDAESMRRQVARGGVDVGVVIPDGAAADFDAGREVPLEMTTSSQGNAAAVAIVVRQAANTAMLRSGQEVALRAGVRGASEERIAAALDRAAVAVPPTRVAVKDTSGLDQAFSGLGQFDLGASTQLLLFSFLSTLSGGAAMISARRNGVIKRIMAAPVTATQAVAGQAAGRLVIAWVQGLYIVLATWLLFDVRWGNLFAVAVLFLAFALVASGVAMIIGVLADNEGLGIGLSVGLGLVLAALGGLMLPLELFSDTMHRVAMFTPHAWAYEAMAEIQRHGGGVLDILPELGVLLVMAAVALGLGGWLLRRSLARAM